MIQRVYNSLAHTAKLYIQILYQWVVIATVLGHLVALQLQLVVFVNLLGYILVVG